MGTLKKLTVLMAVPFLALAMGVAQAGENPLGLSNDVLKGKKVGFIALTLGATYHAKMVDRFQELAKIYDFEFNLALSNREAQRQLSAAEDLIASGVDVIILNPVGDEIVPSIARLCAARKVPMICVDNTSPGEGYTYVGIDNFAIAREVGRYVGNAMPGGGNIVYLRSTATDTGCPALRFGGIMGGVSDQGEIKQFKLVDERYADQDVGEAEGMMQMEELLAANPRIDAVIAHHDAQALGALTAIRNAGRADVKMMIGFDGELRMLEEIKKARGGANGGMDMVTGMNAPTMIAELTVGLVNDILQGKTVGDTFLPNVAISSGNVDDYMKYGF